MDIRAVALQGSQSLSSGRTLRGPVGSHLQGDGGTLELPLSANSEIEEGLVLAPKFDADGLVTCIATDAGSGELLMVAHMNAEALKRTVETGEAWYFSR